MRMCVFVFECVHVLVPSVRKHNMLQGRKSRTRIATRAARIVQVASPNLSDIPELRPPCVPATQVCRVLTWMCYGKTQK